MNPILQYMIDSVALTLKEVVILLGPALLLAFLMHLLSDFLRERSSVVLGRDLYIWLTAPGTAVHELGHAFFCVLFRHQITGMKLFSMGKDGTLGYVNHTYDRRSLYQRAGNFFIGTGPIWLGTVTIYLLAYLLLGGKVSQAMSGVGMTYADFASWTGFVTLAEKIIIGAVRLVGGLLALENFTNFRFYLFVYSVFAIGGHVTLSPPDLKGATSGFWFLLLILWIFNLATMWIDGFAIGVCRRLGTMFAVFNAIMLLALILNGVLALLVLLLQALRGKKG